ncbi:hypothetical protein [Phenylobacterium sp. 58.2.17]|uniref:hypothetical protein n=1 Tax=Phenylobacterium sp. 58.2.17 TaxID=2969306 RepID=UPI002263BFB4|nr:hypothetical protein [Phenylobacterium sp. 58.2.17]MCX7586565.1 hypothetical protein [Phenylobacterium sp. 58.2.17]
MTKRPTKRRAATTYREVAYKPESFDQVFRLAASDWTRPRRVRVSDQARGWTLDAKFTDADGRVYALRTRVRRYADGTMAIAEETLTVRFHIRCEGPAA